jgi:hypothetical protein|tara:strand:+ start:75523 stop:76644 length:1122 start_codon:yes stop_codon:yes gene_type:complete
MSVPEDNEAGERVFGRRLLVERGDIARAQMSDGGSQPSLAEGQALFRIERVALTANNITYAAAGDALNYWRFFPAPDGYGSLPVWGFAECIGSEASGIKPGERVYGYWPIAEMLLIDVGDVSPRGFSDMAPHRQELSPIYNRYDHVEEKPDAARENMAALFRPLFTTGWLIAQQMQIAADYGAQQVIISSASSKTAMATAWNYKRREGEVPSIIGMTSANHRDFAIHLGLYDEVLAYEDLGQIAADVPTAYIDIAGDRTLRGNVHQRFGPHLGYSMAVGLTHWEEGRKTGQTPPPEPKFFFAPDAMQTEIERSSAGEVRKRIDEAWDDFATFAAPMIDIREVEGLADAVSCYQQIAQGELGGATSLIVNIPES